MELTSDDIIFWRYGPLVLNGTLVYTWLVMLILAMGSWLLTRRLESESSPGRWQHMLEAGLVFLRDQIRGASRSAPDRYLPFVGTLFLFILASNLLEILPGFTAPTTSLSTTSALAAVVFGAVPVFGVARSGLKSYLEHYVKPTPLMLPFNIIGELSRTIALSIRLFGNIMSGSLIVAIMLSLAPLFFPVLMQAFGLLIGFIQAYVFSILALVYIASGQRGEPSPRGGDSAGKGSRREDEEFIEQHPQP